MFYPLLQKHKCKAFDTPFFWLLFDFGFGDINLKPLTWFFIAAVLRMRGSFKMAMRGCTKSVTLNGIENVCENAV